MVCTQSAETSARLAQVAAEPLQRRGAGGHIALIGGEDPRLLGRRELGPDAGAERAGARPAADRQRRHETDEWRPGGAAKQHGSVMAHNRPALKPRKVLACPARRGKASLDA